MNKMDQRTQDYRDNFFFMQNMMMQNTLESDKALMTFSLAALAAMAGLGGKLFEPYGKLSFVTISCFIAVAFLVILGYVVSNELLKSARERLTGNYISSVMQPLNDESKPLKFARLSVWLNRFSFGIFTVGLVLFLILLAIYIGGLKSE